jgi:hypothetical protein
MLPALALPGLAMLTIGDDGDDVASTPTIAPQTARVRALV